MGQVMIARCQFPVNLVDTNPKKILSTAHSIMIMMLWFSMVKDRVTIENEISVLLYRSVLKQILSQSCIVQSPGENEFATKIPEISVAEGIIRFWLEQERLRLCHALMRFETVRFRFLHVVDAL